MARKTSLKLKKERQDLLDDLLALDARIVDRAELLCKKFPDAPIGYGAIGKELDNLRKAVLIDVNEYLKIISKIEEYNQGRSGVKQMNIFN